MLKKHLVGPHQEVVVGEGAIGSAQVQPGALAADVAAAKHCLSWCPVPCSHNLLLLYSCSGAGMYTCSQEWAVIDPQSPIHTMLADGQNLLQA